MNRNALRILLGIVLIGGCTGSPSDPTMEEAMQAWPEFRTLSEQAYGIQQNVEEGGRVTGADIVRIETQITAFAQSQIPSSYRQHASAIQEARTKFAELIESAKQKPDDDFSQPLNDAAVILYRLPGGSI